MGNPRPETHRRSLVAPAFSSDPAVTGLVGETTADDAFANLGSRVTALEGAPAAGFNVVDDQQVLHPGAADFDFLFPGAPAAEPTQAEFYCETGGVYGNVYVKVIGDVVYGEFAGVNFGRPCAVAGGIERINGGLRFKGGAVWVIGGGAAEVDPFTWFTLTIAASF